MKKSMNRIVCGLTAAVMMGTLTACSGVRGRLRRLRLQAVKQPGIQRAQPSRERPRQR